MLRNVFARVLGAFSLLLCFSFLFSTLHILAAPIPPLRVVNHETKECSDIFGGDECMDCFPPEGWEILGDAYDIPCPEGYAEVASPGYTCEHFQEAFCCTEGHSGASGDCTNLVVNRGRKQCAFVSSANTTELPRGWRPKPDSTESYDWVCPGNYEWVDDVNAETGSGGFNFSCCSSAMLLAPVALVLVINKKHR